MSGFIPTVLGVKQMNRLTILVPSELNVVAELAVAPRQWG